LVEGSIRDCKARNQSCIMSVAQPAPELLDLFDNLLLMAKGKQIWFGPPRKAVDYFESLGYCKPDETAYPDFLQEMCGNPHVFYDRRNDGRIKRRQFNDPAMDDEFDEVNVESDQLEKERLESGFDMRLNSAGEKVIRGSYLDVISAWRESQERENLGLILWNEFAPRSKDHIGISDQSFVASNLTQLRVLVWRQWIYARRNTPLTIGKIITVIFLAVIIGSIYWDPDDTFPGQQTKFSAYFILLMFPPMLTSSAIPSLADQTFVHNFQSSSKYYNITNFVMALSIVDLFWFVLEGFMWVIPFSLMSKLKGDPFISEAFWIQFLLILALLIIGKSVANWLVFLLKDEQTATQNHLLPLFLMILDVGFFLPKMNEFWEALQYVNPMYFAFKSFAIVEWGDKGREIVYDENTMMDGKEFLAVYNIKDFKMEDRWLCCLYTWLLTLGWFLLGLYAAHSNQGENFVETQLDDFDEDILNEKKQQIAKRESTTHMVKPEFNVVISWEDLVYIVPDPKDKDAGMCGKKRDLRILKGVHGFAKPGSLIALMGPSGAGKTTLLDVLAGRKTGGTISGTIKINGQPKNDTFNYIAGYVEQFDSHEPWQTVREAITFAATLRLPSTLSESDIGKRVVGIVKKLMLQTVVDSMIGSDKKGGISPEYRKLVSIACEMVVDPGLLFLDEPTTGLDAASARNVMKAVKRLSATRAVVCTIHQPSAEIFDVFTDVLLMQRGGRVCYFGDSYETADYFHEMGFPEVEEGVNVADYILECSMCTGDACPGENRVLDPDSNVDITSPADLFESHPRQQKLLNEVETCGNGMEVPEVDLVNRASFCTQLRFLISRTWKSKFRNTEAIVARLSAPAVQGLLFGLPFLQLDNTYSGLQGKQSVLLFIIFILGFGGFADLPVIFGSRLHEFREKESRMYGEAALWLSTELTNIPIKLFCIMLLGNLIFWMCGLTITAESYFVFLLVLVAGDLSLAAFCDVIVALSSNLEMVMMLDNLSILVWYMNCGFYIREEQIPDFWIWSYWFNAFRYPLQAAMINEFENLDKNEKISGVPNKYPEDYMNDLGLDKFTKWECIGITFAFWIFLKMIELLIRYNVSHIRR